MRDQGLSRVKTFKIGDADSAVLAALSARFAASEGAVLRASLQLMQRVVEQQEKHDGV